MDVINYNGHSYGILVEGEDIVLQGLHNDLLLPGLYSEIEKSARLKVSTTFVGSDDFPEMDYDHNDVANEIDETIEQRIKQHLKDYLYDSEKIQVINYNVN